MLDDVPDIGIPVVSPSDETMERMLLAMIVADNGVIDAITDLSPDVFFDPVNQAIFEACRDLRSEGRPINLVTLRGESHGIRLGDGSDVSDYLRSVSLAGERPDARDIARNLKDLATRRALMRVGDAILEMAQNYRTKPAAVVHEALKQLDAIDAQSKPAGKTLWTVAEAIDDFLETISSGEVPDTISSGLATLDKMTGGFRPGEYWLLAGRPSMGKAQPLSSQVLLASGEWRQMRDIKIGDELASIDGRPSNVIAIHPQGAKQVFKMMLKDGRSTECCADHLWKVMYRDWDAPRVLSTATIIEMLKRKRYHKRLSIDLASGAHGSGDNELPLDPYLLGAMIANGGLTRGSLILTTPYDSVIRKVQDLVFADGLELKPRGDFGWCVSSGRQGGAPNPIIETIRKLGLWGLKSEEKFIPAEYLRSTIAARTLLLQGLMDGDGWVEKFGAMRYGTSSAKLASGIQALVRSLGGLATVSERSPKYSHKGEKKSGKTAYVVNMTFADGSPFVSVPAKLARVKPLKSAYLSILSVEPSRVTDAQCITVSHPSQLYVTDDYIVTHNSSLAVSLALGAARAKRGVMMFSLEMPVRSLSARMASEAARGQKSHVPYSAALAMNLSQHQGEELARHAMAVRDIDMVIDEQAALTASEIAARVRKHKEANPNLGLVIVDHIGKVNPSKRYAGNRTAEMTEISNRLAEIAKSERVCVLALSQLNRQVEGRDNKRPGLSDLRDSGSLEQDADVVLFAYRGAYYLERTKEDDDVKEMARTAMLAELMNRLEVGVAKNRNGQTGSVDLYVDMAYNYVRDLEQHDAS